VSLKNLFVLWHASRVFSKEANLQSHKPKQYTMNNLKLLLLTGSAFAFAGAASAQISTIVEQWTFDGANPETGINGTTVSTWTTTAPNSVPSAGVLRYATSGNGSGGVPSTIDVASIDQLILTIDLANFYIGTDGTDTDQVVFQFIEDGAANIELELNVFTSGSFSIDMEGFGATLSPDVVPGLASQTATGNGATLIVATWDFAVGSMSFEVSGAGTQTESLTGLSDPTLTQITGFRPRGGNMAHGTFLDLDTVTIETVAVPEPSTFALLAGFATLGLVLYRRRR
jgi:hypothetical protein